MTEHTHPDTDHLHVGCQACIDRAEEAWWRTAPFRHVIFTVTRDADGETWESERYHRIPDGATSAEIADRYIGGPGLSVEVEVLPDDPPPPPDPGASLFDAIAERQER